MVGGRRAGAGRRKGVPNKINGQLKEMILAALTEAGGVDYLKRRSADQPAAFLSLLGKVLPLTLAADNQNPPTFTITWKEKP